MFKIAYDPIYQHPLPAGHRFPMQKYELIPLQLLYQGIVEASQFFSPQILNEQIILLTHEESYWQKLKNLNLTYQEARRIGFPISETLITRELTIAQGTLEASCHAIQDGIAFNVAGGTHHAGSHWGEGFCLLNDQAIAANYLLENGLAKNILIIDLDVHQGNGTAQIFKNQKNVFTFSVHGERNFPFRKEQSDKDIGLPNGVTDLVYLEILKQELPTIFEQFKPDFIFYLAGVDVLETDALGKFNLSMQACMQRDVFVFELCKKLNIPVQVSMGGGYSPKINTIVDAHCNTFKAAKDIFD